jgi:type IV secretion system protein VirB11
LADLEQAGAFSRTRSAGREASLTDRQLMDLYRAENWRAFLHLAVASGQNVVFAGEVGSGKNSIRLSARIVTIEDMPQILGLPHENVANMLYSEGGQGTAPIAAEDLIVAALRMGMDILFMREMCNAAAFAYLRALASGHPGMTTCHAASAEGAFDAIRLMVKQHQAGRQLADDDVRAMLRPRRLVTDGFRSTMLLSERYFLMSGIG